MIPVHITPSELLVTKLVVEGLENKQIAFQLHKTEQTVKNQLGSLYTKLGLFTRLELAVWAVANRVVDVPEKYVR